MNAELEILDSHKSVSRNGIRFSVQIQKICRTRLFDDTRMIPHLAFVLCRKENPFADMDAAIRDRCLEIRPVFQHLILVSITKRIPVDICIHRLIYRRSKRAPGSTGLNLVQPASDTMPIDPYDPMRGVTALIESVPLFCCLSRPVHDRVELPDCASGTIGRMIHDIAPNRPDFSDNLLPNRKRCALYHRINYEFIRRNRYDRLGEREPADKYDTDRDAKKSSHLYHRHT